MRGVTGDGRRNLQLAGLEVRPVELDLTAGVVHAERRELDLPALIEWTRGQEVPPPHPLPDKGTSRREPLARR